MSKQSFYIIGGDMPCDAPSYVVRQADDALYESLLEGKFCYVLDSRQIGKSSLKARVSARLAERGVCVATPALEGPGRSLSIEQWYFGILFRIGQQFGIEDELEAFWLDHPLLGPLQRWTNAITEVVLPRCPGRLVIFVDEIDMVRILPFNTDEFFAAIRGLHNRRTAEPELERLTFCLLGTATPSDLITDPRTTPFNIGQRIELYDFTEGEASPLAEGLLGRDEETRNKLLKRILYWTNGQPYLTQRLCQSVAEDATVKSSRGVDRLCKELFFTPQAKKDDHNLQHVSPRILKGNKGEKRGDEELAAILDLYKRILGRKRVKDDNTNPLIGELKLSGIIRANDGSLRVRNRIYVRVFGREWLKENMPDAEKRRQRVAFRRGLLRAAAVAITIISVISVLWIMTMERGETNRQLLYVARIKLAERAWEEGNFSQMHELLNYYLPGSGQEDLCGFDWYYLWRLCHNESLTLQHSDTIDSDFGKALREVDLIAFSPDGKMLASSGDGKLKLWDLTTGKVLLAKRDSSEFDRTNASYIAFSPEGKKLIAIYRKHPDLKFENEQYAGRVNDIFNISVTQLDLAIGQEIVIHKYSQTSKSVPPSAFSLDRNWLALGSDNGAIKLVDVTTGQEMMTIRTGMKKIGSVVFSPNGHWIAAIGDDYSKVMMWDIINSRERLTLSNKLKNGDTIKSIGFSQDSKRFASASYKGEVRLWGITNAQLFHGSKNKHLPALVVEQMMVNGLSRLSTVFSPDLKKIAFADSNNTVKLIDIITGQIQHTFKGHWNNISSIAFSRDGRRLASGSSDSTVKLWDLNESKDILDYKMYSFDSLAFSSDGDGLGLGSIDGTIKMFEILTGRELFTVMALPRKFFKVIDPFVFPTNWRELDSKDEGGRKLNVSGEERLVSLKGYTGDIHFIKVSPDGKTLVSVSNDNILRLWDINNGQELLTLKGHLNNISSVSFSPDGKRLASGSRDKTVKLWDLNTGQELLTLKGYMSVQYGISLNSRWFPDPSNSIAFSPNGSKLASGSDGHMVKLWDLNTGQELQSLKGHLGVVTSVAFSPDGERLATGSKDKTVKLWDLNTGRESLTLKGHSEEVTSVAFSPDGQKLASGSGQKTVKFWDINNNKELLTLEDADKGVGYNWLRSSIAFLPDGNRMAMGGADGTLKLWDLKNQQGLPTFEKSHTSITSVALSRNGDKLVTGGENGYLTLWDLNNGQKLDEFEGHASPVTAVAFSPDGKSFASVSDDKTIKLWDIFFSLGLERLTLKGHLKGIHSVAFSPDGKRLATGSRDNTVKLWDINTGQELLTLKGHSQELLMGLSDEVIAVAFSPDGRTLASVNRGRIVKLWRSATEQEVLARTKQ